MERARLKPPHVEDAHSLSSPRAAGIVVVEDDADARRLVTALLTAVGYAVRDFADGAAAMDYLLAGQDPPRVVVTDLTMPRMDGRQLIEAMRANPRLAP